MSANFEWFERELDVLERRFEQEQKKIERSIESSVEDLQILRAKYMESRAKIMEGFRDACGSKAS